MHKIRPLLGLTVLVICFAMSTVNASAKFVSNNSHTSGPLQLKTGTEPSFSIEVAGVKQFTFKCATLENGVWKIRKSELAQSEVLEGGHLDSSGQYTKCVLTLAGESKLANINKGCELQVEQDGSTKFTGGVVSSCSITSGGCVITVAAGAPNTGLQSVSVVSIETKNLEIRSNVTGFVAAPNEKCKNLGITGTSGSFLQTVIAHEQKIE